MTIFLIDSFLKDIKSMIQTNIFSLLQAKLKNRVFFYKKRKRIFGLFIIVLFIKIFVGWPLTKHLFFINMGSPLFIKMFPSQFQNKESFSSRSMLLQLTHLIEAVSLECILLPFSPKQWV